MQTHVSPSTDGFSLQTRFVMKKIPAAAGMTILGEFIAGSITTRRVHQVAF
jgi:hypothetical protein